MKEPKRILHVIAKMDRAGAETAIMNWYRHIDRTKIQFDFLVFEGGEGDFDKEIRALGGRIFHIKRFVGCNLLGYQKALRQLLKEHPEWETVHGHISYCAPIYLGIAKKLKRQTIAHAHNAGLDAIFTDVILKIAGCFTRRIADVLFACSHEAAVFHFGKGVLASPKCHLLPNGIDVSKYKNSDAIHAELKEKYGWSDKTVIGYVARLVDVKNHDFLLHLFAELRRLVPDSLLILAGRGPLLPKLEKRANELSISREVQFLGDRTDVPDLMKAFDLSVIPSRKEGFSVASIELEAAGTPTLASTEIPSDVAIAKNYVRMSLEKPTDEWAEAAVALLGDTNYQKGPDEVTSAGFDVQHIAKHLEGFYLEILSCNLKVL